MHIFFCSCCFKKTPKLISNNKLYLLNKEEEICCFCLDKLINKPCINLTKCNHILHEECFNVYKEFNLNNNKNILCPLCNENID